MKTSQSKQPSASLSKGQAAKRILPLLIGGLLIVTIIVYALTHMHKLPSAAVEPNAQPSAPAPLRPGAKAPQFSVQTPLGPLGNDTFAGKPYMLEIFATWCPHCQRMTAVLRSLRAKIPESRLGMLSVTGSPYAASSTQGVPEAENQADVDAFDKQFNVTWLSVFDRDLKVAQTWGLDGFPQIFFVNAKGTIVFSGSGEMSEAKLLAAARKAGA